MLLLLLFLLTILSAIIPQGYSVMCYICDTIEDDNCFGSACTGTACIKRFAIINGLKRVQKMCQETSEPFLEYCDTSVLWKGGIGIECICQTDYCNSSRELLKNSIISLFSYIFYILWVFF